MGKYMHRHKNYRQQNLMREMHSQNRANLICSVNTFLSLKLAVYNSYVCAHKFKIY